MCVPSFKLIAFENIVLKKVQHLLLFVTFLCISYFVVFQLIGSFPCNKLTVGPIALKFGMPLGDPFVTAYAAVTGGISLHVRTCRPRFCISGTAWPIGFNFGVWVGGHELGAEHKSWVEYSARAHVHTALLYLRNGLTDCVQIWYVGWGSLSRYIRAFHKSWVGWGISARAHVHLPHLRISGSD